MAPHVVYPSLGSGLPISKILKVKRLLINSLPNVLDIRGERCKVNEEGSREVGRKLGSSLLVLELELGTGNWLWLGVRFTSKNLKLTQTWTQLTLTTHHVH